MKRRNRRRIAKKHGAIFVGYGRLVLRDPNYGSTVACYVCNAPIKWLHLACIEDRKCTSIVPLCAACLSADVHTNAVAEKFLALPDLKIEEGKPAASADSVEADSRIDRKAQLP